jgi:hypothetical protein
MAQTTKHCNRCDTLLIGHEHLSDTCNRCLDLGYQSMTDEAYDAIDTHAHEARYAPLVRSALTGLALALALTAPTLAHDCPITGHTGEGFPVATCADGTVWYRDMDGQPYPNAAGNPVYAPGTWIELK